MAKRETTRNGGPPRSTATAWMSLREASELTGRGRAELRTQIAAGELSARTIRRGDKVEHRLTRASLAEAGLIGAPSSEPSRASEPLPAAAPSPEATPDTMAQLIALIREQNQRIATLEDQRTQLAARLGATIEAMHQLEDRLDVILDARPLPEPPALADALPITTDDGLVIPSISTSPTGVADDHVPAQPSQRSQLHGVRRSLSRLVREVAQPRLRELTGGPRREPSPGD